MNATAHPLNSIIRNVWRASGHSIEAVATCCTLGGTPMNNAQAHGIFHAPQAHDYHEVSLVEMKCILRGLLGWERFTTETMKNRYSAEFTEMLWVAYDTANNAHNGIEVSWSSFINYFMEPACNDQNRHWNERRVAIKKATGNRPAEKYNNLQVGTRPHPLAEALMVVLR